MAEYQTIEYRGHQIVTGFEDHDLSIFNPRDHDGNVGTMLCWHRNYILGDEQPDASPSDYFSVECPECEGNGWFDEDGNPESGYNTAATVECKRCQAEGEIHDIEAWKAKHGVRVILPLYLYDHGGITMSVGGFSCPWDSGQVGWIHDTPEGVQGAMGKHTSVEDGYKFTGEYHTEDGKPPTDEWIESALKSEVRVYADYLEGDIMWYRTEGPTDGDSCGGFFPDEKGSHDYMVDEAKASIDSSIRYAWEKGIDEVLEQRAIARIMAL